MSSVAPFILFVLQVLSNLSVTLSRLTSGYGGRSVVDNNEARGEELLGSFSIN